MLKTSRLLGLSLVLALGGATIGCDGDGSDDAGPRTDAGDGTMDAGPRTDAGDGTVDAGPGGVDAGPGGSDAGPPADPCMRTAPPALDVEVVGTFNRPVFVTATAADPGALYIVEQPGTVQRRAPDGTVNPFVTVSVRGGDSGGDERGLLGMAFHPDYASNGRFFLYYVASNGNNRLTEHSRNGADPTRGDAAVVATLIDQPDFATNHNGGMLAFSPRDGFLYVGMGDGGSFDDPRGNGLDTNTLLGKINRLDVDNAAGQFAAAGNPFTAGGGLPQIWAYGLRNPFRFSFDRATADLWIGDVGQNMWEEVDFQPADFAGGANYGWRAYEGTREFARASASDLAMATNHTPPIYEYNHSEGCSIAGGFVYRGSDVAGLQGYYLFSDYCAGEVRVLRQCPGGVDVTPDLRDEIARGFSLGVTSFGEDERGELYLTGLGGEVVRIIGG